MYNHHLRGVGAAEYSTHDFPAPNSNTASSSIAPNMVEYAVTKFAFITGMAGELQLAVGDVVRVVRHVDENWSAGHTSNGQEGLYPNNHVETIRVPCLTVGQRLFLAIADFPGGESGDLRFSRGQLVRGLKPVDSQWWEGMIDSHHRGIFPLTHVRQVATCDDEDVIGQLASHDTGGTLGYGTLSSGTDSSMTPSSVALENPETVELLPTRQSSPPPPYTSSPCLFTVRALIDSVPQLDGELGFKAGDIVAVLKVLDMDWYEGEYGGRRGMFLQSLVEPATKSCAERSQTYKRHGPESNSSPVGIGPGTQSGGEKCDDRHPLGPSSGKSTAGSNEIAPPVRDSRRSSRAGINIDESIEKNLNDISSGSIVGGSRQPHSETARRLDSSESTSLPTLATNEPSSSPVWNDSTSRRDSQPVFGHNSEASPTHRLSSNYRVQDLSDTPVNGSNVEEVAATARPRPISGTEARPERPKSSPRHSGVQGESLCLHSPKLSSPKHSPRNSTHRETSHNLTSPRSSLSVTNADETWDKSAESRQEDGHVRSPLSDVTRQASKTDPINQIIVPLTPGYNTYTQDVEQKSSVRRSEVLESVTNGSPIGDQRRRSTDSQAIRDRREAASPLSVVSTHSSMSSGSSTVPTVPMDETEISATRGRIEELQEDINRFQASLQFAHEQDTADEDTITFYMENINGMRLEMKALVQSLQAYPCDESLTNVTTQALEEDQSPSANAEKPTPVSRLSHQRETRDRVIQEIIETEESYHDDLALCFRTYLGKDAPTPPAGVDTELVFGNLAEVIDLSGKLVGALRRGESSMFEDRVVGVVFIELTSAMRDVYAPYCRNHDEASDALQKLCASPTKDTASTSVETKCDVPASTPFPGSPQGQGKSPVVAWVDAGVAVMRRSTNVFTLASVLIKPVQRLLKYSLLLEELVKSTEENHPDKRTAQEAVKAMRGLAADINEYKRRKDLVYRYRGDAKTDSSFRDRVAKLNMKSIRKKSQRIGMRVTSVFTASNAVSEEQDEEVFARTEEQFRSLIKATKEFSKNATSYVESVEKAVASDETAAHRVAELFAGADHSGSPAPPSLSYTLDVRTGLRAAAGRFKASISIRILDPLQKILALFAGPDKVIGKRRDKQLDFEAAVRRAERSGDAEGKMTAAAREELDCTRKNFEALDVQLRQELPEFNALVSGLLTYTVCQFMRCHSRFTGEQLPRLLPHWSTASEGEEAFRMPILAPMRGGLLQVGAAGSSARGATISGDPSGSMTHRMLPLCESPGAAVQVPASYTKTTVNSENQSKSQFYF